MAISVPSSTTSAHGLHDDRAAKPPDVKITSGWWLLHPHAAFRESL
jgi:hypothetical protein